jgi:hypothetical protein
VKVCVGPTQLENVSWIPARRKMKSYQHRCPGLGKISVKVNAVHMHEVYATVRQHLLDARLIQRVTLRSHLVIQEPLGLR